MTWNRMCKSIAVFCAAGAWLAAEAGAGPFTPGNLAVLQVGNGTNVSTNAIAGAVTVKEFTTAGAPVQSVSIPSSASGSNLTFTLPRGRTLGQLSLSTDGRFLSAAGWDVPVGQGSVAGQYSNNRVIARIDAAGNADTSTALTNASYSGDSANIRSAPSTDGSGFWTVGAAGVPNSNGAWYVPFGSIGGTQIVQSELVRNAVIAGSQLYLSTGDPNVPSGAIQSVAGGLPTVGLAGISPLPGFPGASENYLSFVFLGNALYIANDSNSVGPGLRGLDKWVFNAGTWSLAATYENGLPVNGANGGLLQVTGRLESGVPVLYATTRGGGANNSLANQLVRFVDDSILNPTSTFTTLATAPANNGFRGVAFTPVPEPSSWLLMSLGVVVLAGQARRRGLRA